ncbi:MAG TPA: 4'-phosphopantetheinyl transferase superfamily protein [Chthonomonadales bacterium]|nr:4'-phosphopantetheinyl transferase superfamily protein [Chthonomonadales bacterium]
MTDWDLLRAESRAAIERRGEALAWLRDAGGGLSLMWLDGRDAGAARTGERALQHAALQISLEPLHRSGAAPDPALCTLTHSPRGAPIVRVRGGAPIARPRVSFCHEGGAHLALAGCRPELRGLGIDAVRLDRLRRRDAGYLRRLARRFLAPAGVAALEAEERSGGREALLLGVAARFALTEAASKALGTGLRLGLGLSGSGGLLPREIGVVTWRAPARIEPGPGARRRMGALRAAHIAGHAAYDDEYAVGAVLLLGAPGETPRSGRT